MTLREIQSQICTLGGVGYVEPDVSLSQTVKRALLTLARDIPIKRKITLFANFPKPTLHIESEHHTGGRTELLPLNGCAFSLRLSGKGEATVYDGRVTRQITFDSPDKTVRGLLYGEGSLTLSGERSYDLFDLLVYGEPYFTDEDEIPPTPSDGCINLSERVTDLLAIAETPTDGYGKEIEGARVEGGRIYLPVGFKGRVSVSYYRAAIPAVIYSPDDTVDIPEEYESLLPLLCAFYAFLDEDPERAETFHSLYLEGVTSLKRCVHPLQSTKYSEVCGWA